MSLIKTNLLRTITAEKVAETYIKSVKKKLSRELEDAADAIEENKNKIEILNDFCLETDRNKGMYRLTLEDFEQRTKQILALEYQIALDEIEYKAKKAIFDKYFGEKE